MFFDIPHKPKYRSSIEFNTTVATKVQGDEQRHCRWLNPKRVFELQFGNTPENALALEEFFVAQKGDFELFHWNWDITGLDYKCFFEGDKLAQKMFEKGYSDTSLAFVSVDDGNILKDRFLQDLSSWDIAGDVSFSSGKASCTGLCSLAQAGILDEGAEYILEVFCENLSGSTPSISAYSACGDESVRSLSSGINTLELTALSSDFVLDVLENSSCEFSNFSLYKKYVHQERLTLQAKAERTKEIMFRTLSDERFTYQNNRRAMWDKPLRRWVLTFDLTPAQSLALQEFFISQKGRYKSFLWCDELGDGGDILVRFDDDKMDFEHFEMGYSQVQIPIVEVI